MKPYKNLSGNSSVKAFQIYGDGIKIQFNDESVYLYLYDKIGQELVDDMKTLATFGKGLGAFIDSVGKETGQELQ
jgi:hypothetical protein